MEIAHQSLDENVRKRAKETSLRLPPYLRSLGPGRRPNEPQPLQIRKYISQCLWTSQKVLMAVCASARSPQAENTEF